VACPAFLASRVTARPLVMVLAEALRAASLLPEGFAEHYDRAVTEVTANLGACLSATGAGRLRELLDAAAALAEEEVQAMAAQRAGPRRATGIAASSVSEHLVQPAGGEDPESEPERGGLQHDLFRLVDEERADRLATRLAQQQRWTDMRRIRELRDPSVSHDWLWALNPAHGATVPPDEFATCVRVRLGAFLTEEPAICTRCGECIADRTASHALCCALPEATKGHYAVRDSLLHLVHLADPSASTEVPELISDAPALRPADIYSTAALPGGQAALDVGVCSPDAANAGDDCCAAMWERKRHHYAAHLEGMQRIGLRYVPIVFSCYGRLHPDPAVEVERIAQQAARRMGVGDHRALLRRAHLGMSVAVWRRAAAMARSCLPTLSKESLAVLFGEVEADELP